MCSIKKIVALAIFISMGAYLLVSYQLAYSQNLVASEGVAVTQNAEEYAQSIAPKQFVFGFLNYDQYRIEAKNIQEVLINSEPVRNEVEIENKVLLNIARREGDAFLINYKVETFEDALFMTERQSQFTQYDDGHMIIADNYLVPYVRNIPRFPKFEIPVGETWQATGQDNILLPGAKEFVLAQVDVSYIYEGLRLFPQDAYLLTKDTKINKLTTAPFIQASYEVKDKKIFNEGVGEFQLFNAVYNIEIWWNIEDQRVEYYREQYKVDITTDIEEIITFNGYSEALMIGISPLERETEKISSTLNRDIGDVEVKSNERGITIVLGNIQFLANSSVLVESEKKKLRELAKALQKYPGRRILVEGHTAYAGTKEGRLQLSNERAKRVMSFLESQSGAQDNNQYYYKGWGAEKPVDTGHSLSDKAADRRVEITILEN